MPILSIVLDGTDAILAIVIFPDLRANLSEWEAKEKEAKQRNEQLQKKLQELDAVKRDMAVQVDRFRLNEKYPFQPSSCTICSASSCM
eukprot:jgi/Phyca11/103680/e_gw1.8.350.1